MLHGYNHRAEQVSSLGSIPSTRPSECNDNHARGSSEFRSDQVASWWRWSRQPR